ncbi:MAG TPA: nicotinate (nicotinamide) nucleotide adenylyltransferase [Bryobacteraceae bacterium]|nr:nicotinate (nicotinamide) nucleotide adenylyltransferase [Bryobacteraceae bacterium]
MPPSTALFGGTFDPVHNTHLAIARAAADTFHLKKVLFVPAGNPPFKAGAMASFEDRVAMLELAVAAEGDPRFEVSRVEDPSAHGGSRSYSILTVEALMRGGTGPLSFIVGADAFADIRKWHRWEELVRRVEFIVVARPGSFCTAPPGATVHELPTLSSPVSSSAVRASLMAHAPSVPVPAPVLRYIREHGLYRSQNP